MIGETGRQPDFAGRRESMPYRQSQEDRTMPRALRAGMLVVLLLIVSGYSSCAVQGALQGARFLVPVVEVAVEKIEDWVDSGSSSSAEVS